MLLLKVCPKCGIEKEDTEFNKAFGCKSCQKEYHRQYYENNKEIILLQQKGYRKTPKGKDVQKTAIKKYQQTYAGRIASYKSTKKYREKKYYEELENAAFYSEMVNLIMLI